MLVWVTGGAGFIGSHIADDLLAGGHEVVVVDDLSTGRRENVPRKATFLEIDLRDGEALGAAFEKHRPDVVTHQAAQTSVSVSIREPLRDAQVNILGGLNLLELCRKHDVSRLVFASTGGALYGEVPDGTAADERTVPEPISPYACSKLSFESYLGAYGREHGLTSTVLRYANVYGPRQDPHGEAGVVAIFSQRMAAGAAVRINARRTPGDDGCVRDYVSVREVVKANRLAIEGKLASRVLNVASGVPTSTRALADAIEAALHVRAQKHDGERRAGDLERSVLQPNAELRSHFDSVPLEEGIEETVAWFRGRA